MPAIDSNTKLLIQNNGLEPHSKAIRFDGASRLTVPDSADWAFGTNAFTVECWAQFDSTGYRILWNKATNDTSYQSFDTNAGNLGFGVVGLAPAAVLAQLPAVIGPEEDDRVPVELQAAQFVQHQRRLGQEGVDELDDELGACRLLEFALYRVDASRCRP